MKILNLYSGIGGNRKLWSDKHQVTAVEFDPNIAEIYKSYFPNDKVIVADAHQFLLDNYKDYDFIWSSPPCPSHSRINTSFINSKTHEKYIKYPAMELYQEILLLKHFFSGYYVVENVIPYYKPLIPAKIELQRHYFWSNINIRKKIFNEKYIVTDIKGTDTIYGFNLIGKATNNKRQILRNLVNPEVAKHIMDCLEVEIYNKETNLFNTKELINN
jgi:DNA (cytosine-5)-methyltransferase 1